jgi:tRNA threonylcarbamoyl adenosine modification protein (Sua5/YciO/YrdC/YwlC family)
LISTEVIKLDPENPDRGKIHKAAVILRKGGLVAFPTETVYGLAANFTNKKSMDRLMEVKNRPAEKLFTVHIADKDKVEEFAMDIPIEAYKLIDKFWPGPLTLVFKSKKNNNQTVGMRMPSNRIALDLINVTAVPIVAPSANISGDKPATTVEEVLSGLDGKIDMALDGGKTSLGVSSTVVDVTLAKPEVKREGAIKKEDIENALRTKNIVFICTGNSCRSVMAMELLKKKMAKRQDVNITAAGLAVLPGMGASFETRKLLEQEGIDVSKHRARQFTAEIAKRADLILVMQKVHEQKILHEYPFVKNRLYLLKEFAKIDDGDLEIYDPIGKSEEYYKLIFEVIKQAVDRVSQLI